MSAVSVRQGALDDDLPPLFDVVLAVAVAVFAQVDLRWNLDDSTHYGPDLAASLLVAVATLALAWRRRRPLTTLVVVAAAVTVPELFTTLTITLWGHFVPLLIAFYSVARWAPRREALIGLVITVASLAVVMLRVPSINPATNIPFSVVPVAGAYVIGRTLRRRRARDEAVAERAAQVERLEAERDALIATAIDEERNRIARELHDIVAHCVTVMVVQAGAAEDLLTRAPERAAEPLRAVQETGQLAIAELGRLLDVLRSDGGPDDPLLSPQPGTSHLPDLVERLSALGLPVDLTIAGRPRALPPGVDLAAYRIVQEALTNTLKHGGAQARARVEVRYLPCAIELEVTDDGPGATAVTGTGHGLVGMTERASIYGGEIEAGTGPDGGYRVRATLPVEAA